MTPPVTILGQPKATLDATAGITSDEGANADANAEATSEESTETSTQTSSYKRGTWLGVEGYAGRRFGLGDEGHSGWLGGGRLVLQQPFSEESPFFFRVGLGTRCGTVKNDGETPGGETWKSEAQCAPNVTLGGEVGVYPMNDMDGWRHLSVSLGADLGIGGLNGPDNQYEDIPTIPAGTEGFGRNETMEEPVAGARANTGLRGLQNPRFNNAISPEGGTTIDINIPLRVAYDIPTGSPYVGAVTPFIGADFSRHIHNPSVGEGVAYWGITPLAGVRFLWDVTGTSDPNSNPPAINAYEPVEAAPPPPPAPVEVSGETETGSGILIPNTGDNVVPDEDSDFEVLESDKIRKQKKSDFDAIDSNQVAAKKAPSVVVHKGDDKAVLFAFVARTKVKLTIQEDNKPAKEYTAEPGKRFVYGWSDKKIEKVSEGSHSLLVRVENDPQPYVVNISMQPKQSTLPSVSQVSVVDPFAGQEGANEFDFRNTDTGVTLRYTSTMAGQLKVNVGGVEFPPVSIEKGENLTVPVLSQDQVNKMPDSTPVVTVTPTNPDGTESGAPIEAGTIQVGPPAPKHMTITDGVALPAADASHTHVSDPLDVSFNASRGGKVRIELPGASGFSPKETTVSEGPNRIPVLGQNDAKGIKPRWTGKVRVTPLNDDGSPDTEHAVDLANEKTLGPRKRGKAPKKKGKIGKIRI